MTCMVVGEASSGLVALGRAFRVESNDYMSQNSGGTVSGIVLLISLSASTWGDVAGVLA